MANNPLRGLPSVNQVLETSCLRQLAQDYAHETVLAAVRFELDSLRRQMQQGVLTDFQEEVETVGRRVRDRLHSQIQPWLRPVINATGIILHTNLGRAPVAEEAARAAYEAARGYVNLELDLQTGKRSSRQLAIRDWICRLTGAESATAVNNNAAATVIALRALGRGKEVVVSRGQLIEIGGSFRIPEIMAVSGALLREVGTTNITRLADFEQAIGPNTAALMQIHTSNYRISGFTKSVPLPDLVALGRKHGLPVLDDLGSGALIDFGPLGFQGEPVVGESLAAGADLALFSGDKLLGGPQAGIIAGRQEYIQRIEKDPLMRAFRLDKMALASLEATLGLYVKGKGAPEAVPVLQLLSIPLDDLRTRAEALAGRLQDIKGLSLVQVRPDETYVGGGSLPDQALASWVVELQAQDLSDAELAFRLRTAHPAVVGRTRDNRVVLDVRTIFPHQEQSLVEVVQQVLNRTG